jgi:hypothetical protein
MRSSNSPRSPDSSNLFGAMDRPTCATCGQLMHLVGRSPDVERDPGYERQQFACPVGHTMARSVDRDGNTAQSD